jgi:hypothetical protein
MTPSETLKALKLAGKPIVRSHFYRLVNKLAIRPVGHSRPKHYPADTADRILSHLGFFSGAAATERTASRAIVQAAPAGKLISVRALRAAKPQHKKGSK